MGISWQARGDRGISTLQKIITTAVAATVGAGVLVAAPAWGDTIVCRIGGLIVGTAAACPGGEFVGGGPAVPPLTATPQNAPAPSGSPIPRRTLLDGDLADDDGLLIGGGYTATVDPSVPATANVTYTTPYGPITLPYQDFAVSCYGTGFDTCVGWIPWYAEEYGRRLDTAMPSLATCAPDPADAARPVEFELVADPTSHWADVLVRTGTGVTSLAGVGELDDDPGRYAAAAYAVRQFLLQLSMRPAPANATQAAQLRLTLDAIGRFIPRLESASESVAGLDCAAYADAVTALGTSTAGDPIGVLEICADPGTEIFATACRGGYETEPVVSTPAARYLDPRLPLSWAPDTEGTVTTIVPDSVGGPGRITSVDIGASWCEAYWQACLDRLDTAFVGLETTVLGGLGTETFPECAGDSLGRTLLANNKNIWYLHLAKQSPNFAASFGVVGLVDVLSGSWRISMTAGGIAMAIMIYQTGFDITGDYRTAAATRALSASLVMVYTLVGRLRQELSALSAPIWAKIRELFQQNAQLQEQCTDQANALVALQEEFRAFRDMVEGNARQGPP